MTITPRKINHDVKVLCYTSFDCGCFASGRHGSEETVLLHCGVQKMLRVETCDGWSAMPWIGAVARCL